MSTLKGGSMMVFVVLVAAMATTEVEAGTMGQQQQQQQQQQQNEELQSNQDSTDWRPHLATGFRTGFSRPIDHGPMLEESSVAVIGGEISLKPVKNEKKKAYIKNTSEKELSEAPHSRSRRFIGKHHLRAVAIPLSIFHFLGFMPVVIPGIPLHDYQPIPDRNPYRITHDVKLRVPHRVKRRRRVMKKY